MWPSFTDSFSWVWEFEGREGGREGGREEGRKEGREREREGGREGEGTRHEKDYSSTSSPYTSTVYM